MVQVWSGRHGWSLQDWQDSQGESAVQQLTAHCTSRHIRFAVLAVDTEDCHSLMNHVTFTYEDCCTVLYASWHLARCVKDSSVGVGHVGVQQNAGAAPGMGLVV